MKLIRFTGIILLLSGLLFSSCKKDCPDHNIVVDAGNSQQKILPDNFATLTGAVVGGGTSTDAYLWNLISGPNTPVITGRNSLTANITGLVEGTYVYQLQGTNSYGETGIDTTSVVVLPVVARTLVLQPANNPYEGVILSHIPSSWAVGSSQIFVEAWTINGDFFTVRTALKFDYAGIPSNAIIDNATLYLYSDPHPLNGDQATAQDGPANSFSIRRITSNWVLPNPFTWSSQPTTSASNEVIVPQSASSTESVAVNVTNIVKDQQVSGNNGFFMALRNEATYNIRQFASSYITDATLHPKLVINYH